MLFPTWVKQIFAQDVWVKVNDLWLFMFFWLFIFEEVYV